MVNKFNLCLRTDSSILTFGPPLIWWVRVRHSETPRLREHEAAMRLSRPRGRPERVQVCVSHRSEQNAAAVAIVFLCFC